MIPTQPAEISLISLGQEVSTRFDTGRAAHAQQVWMLPISILLQNVCKYGNIRATTSESYFTTWCAHELFNPGILK